MTITNSRRTATSTAIAKIAYYTARDAKGKRCTDAREHCRQLGINPDAGTFEAATNKRASQ